MPARVFCLSKKRHSYSYR